MKPQSNIKRIIISFRTALLPAVGLLLIAGILLTCPARADGNIIYVNAGAGGNNDGTSWADAYIYLQDALDQANANNATDYEIWVAAGVYHPDEDSDGGHITDSATEYFTLNYNNVQIYGGFAATETLRTERDWETNITILSGDIDGNDATDANGVVTTTANISGNNAYHVIYLNGKTNEVISSATVIDGFTVTAGHADSPSQYIGGGLYCAGDGIGNECSPSLVNITFSGNSADAGGGMYNSGNGGVSSPGLVNVTFSGNSAYYSGGGMYNSGEDGGVSSPVLTSVTFSGNSAGNGEGGGMCNYGDYGVSSPSLVNVTFSGNSAGYNGGGIYNSGFGGVSSPVLINVTFGGNSAGYSGGGIYNDGDLGVSSPALTNVILWGNMVAGSGSQVYNLSATPAFSYTLVQSDTNAIINAGTSYITYTGNIITDDPLFTDANGADNIAGTGDDDLSLQFFSPAVDAGDNSALPADIYDLDGDTDTTESIPVDVAGNPRFIDAVMSDTGNGNAPLVDMGAYEEQSAVIAHIYLPLVAK